jgi:hypothetical protein
VILQQGLQLCDQFLFLSKYRHPSARELLKIIEQRVTSGPGVEDTNKRTAEAQDRVRGHYVSGR